jgi:putative aldouronate transport system substrate-binding protein
MKPGKLTVMLLALVLLLSTVFMATAQTIDPSSKKLWLSPQKVTLRFATHQGTNSAMAIPSNDLAVYQLLEKLTNVHIEWETVPYDNYKEVMSTRVAAGGDLPDILNLTYLGNYAKLASDGIIIAQNDLISKYGVNIKQFFAKNPAYKAMMTAPDGNIYCIEDTVLDSHLSIMPMIDKYAMQRVGMTMPTTTDQFYNLLKAFKTKDINGNGQGDEVPFALIFNENNQEYVYQLANAFGLEMTWGGSNDPVRMFRVKNGKMECQFQLPEFKAFLTWMNKLYTEGLLNKDLTSSNYDRLVEYVTKGQSPVVSFWSTYAYLFGAASPDNQGDKDGSKTPVFIPMSPLKAPNGDQFYTKRLSLNADGMGITTKASPDKQVVAMKWIDFLFNSPESLLIQANGVPGLSFTQNADGSVKDKMSPSGMEWSAYVTSLGGNQPPRAHQQLLAAWRSWMPKWLEDIDASYQKYYKDPSVVSIQWTQDEEDALKAKITDLNTYILESVTKFIMGQTPISQFDAFSKELTNRGIGDIQQLYTQRWQRQVKVLGK